MIPFFAQHLYFLSCLYFLILFLGTFFFIQDRTTRKHVLVVSLVFAIANLFIRHMYADWWNPVFVWKPIPFEDPLFTFVVTGFITSLYAVINRHFKREIVIEFSRTYKIFIILGSIIAIFGSFYILLIGSFWATIVTMLFVSIFVFFKIPQVLKSVLITAIIVTIISVPGYLYGTYLHPGWIQEYWTLSGLPSKLLFGIPVGEYAFYFFDTFLTVAIYELLFRKKI
jgi:hypothetical protein